MVRLQEKIGQTIMHALALAVLVIGISMGLRTRNVLIPIAALAIGSIVGEKLIWRTGLSAGENLRR